MTEKVGKIEVVIKGGQPWGFRLRANSENRSTVAITEICPGGKAALQGELKVGDNVIKINGIQCLSLEDALQLIDSAFRTLTLLVWRPSQCSEDVNDKALEPDFKKFNTLTSFPAESYPASFHIYENLLDVSQGIVQKCAKTYSSQISTWNSKVMFGSGSSTDNINRNGARKLKSTCEYLPPKLILPNLCLKTDFDVNCVRESCDGSDGNLKCLTLTKEVQPELKPFAKSHFPANLQENCSNSYRKNYVPSVNLQEMNCMYKKSLKKHCLENSLKSNQDNWNYLTEPQGCVYPNCQNQYRACKVHSPPERDIVYSACSPLKITVKNQPPMQSLSQSPLKYDQIYENMEIFNDSKQNTSAISVKASSTKEHSLFKVPSNNLSETQLNEQNFFSSNSSCANSLNLCKLKNASMSENNFSRIINYENVPNKEFYSLSSMRTSVQDMHQTEIHDQPNLSSVSHVKGLSNSTLYMFSNKSSVNSTMLINANEFHSGCDENNLEEELIEIDKRYENSLNLPESGCHTPPLPSPPPEYETEILETDEPLPPPPFLSPDVNVPKSAQEDTEIVQTIYANLEMLKIQCSLVSSGTQTTLQLSKNSTVKDFSDFGLKMPVQKIPQSVKDPLLHIQLENSKKTESHALQTQFQNYASLVEKSVQNQEQKFYKNALSLPVTSAYFTTSVPKAKLLTQFTSKFEHKNMTFVKELSNEKEELLESIAKKLRILKQEKAALQEELKQNEELGNNLASKLENVAKKSETQKFKLHVEELEKITNLLLSLSGRLARTENALLILPAESSEEKEFLEAKYYKLTQQYDEAVHLQRNIEKRNNQVSIFLFKYLTEDELVDYDHFIHMKVKLLVDYKDLLEKIKLGEEQLYALKSSFNTNSGSEIKTDLCNNIYVL